MMTLACLLINMLQVCLCQFSTVYYIFVSIEHLFTGIQYFLSSCSRVLGGLMKDAVQLMAVAWFPYLFFQCTVPPLRYQGMKNTGCKNLILTKVLVLTRKTTGIHLYPLVNSFLIAGLYFRTMKGTFLSCVLFSLV